VTTLKLYTCRCSIEIFVVVITGFSEEERALRKIRKTGHTPEEVLEELRKQFQETLNINYDIPIIPVELLAEDDAIDVKKAKLMRKLIFDRCFEIPGLPIKHGRVNYS
jgi:hypothetical protein